MLAECLHEFIYYDSVFTLLSCKYIHNFSGICNRNSIIYTVIHGCENLKQYIYLLENFRNPWIGKYWKPLIARLLFGFYKVTKGLQQRVFWMKSKTDIFLTI